MPVAVSLSNAATPTSVMGPRYARQRLHVDVAANGRHLPEKGWREWLKLWQGWPQKGLPRPSANSHHRYLNGHDRNSTTPAITIPEQTTSGVAGGLPCSLMGSGAATVLNLVGPASTAIFAHRSNNYNPQFGIPAQHTMGFIRDLVIDGTSAAAGSVGLDAGSGWGLDANVTIVNFTASGCVAFNQINRNNWTEKCRFRLSLMNNATAAVVGAQSGSALSHDYNEFDFYIFTNDGQNGIVVQDGSHVGGPFFRIHGNVGNWTTLASGAAVGPPPTTAQARRWCTSPAATSPP